MRIEATWGADPLEYYGGFHSLEHDTNATFRSSLAHNGSVTWTTHDAELSYESNNIAYADLSVSFPDVDWAWQKVVYGWSALQWQGWARGELYVQDDNIQVLLLQAENVLEYWIDGEHYWGGDFYGYRKVPIPLHLEPGVHTIELRLIRDVRSMGGTGTNPSVDVKLEVKRSWNGLESLLGFDRDVMISDVVGGDFGPLVNPWASIQLRNDGLEDIYIGGIEGPREVCVFELLSKERIKIAPGQSRPVAFEVGCIPSYNRRINMLFKYRIGHGPYIRSWHFSTWPRVWEGWDEPHRMTFLSSTGVVSYAILRPPPRSLECGRDKNITLPVLLALHGAGLDAAGDMVRHSLDDLSDLCAWELFPTGSTPWSGDDWHIWGLADVEAAIAAIPKWIERTDWDGAGVDIDKWLVAGHSNGGQGAWYALTHRPDKLLAAAVVSGYSSIQNYVPYTFWHTSEPQKEALIQSTLLPYRHELLLENARDIPVVQQHGSADDNVPVYNARSMSQRIHQAGAYSEYFEMPHRPHFWNGVMATKPLSHFFNKHLERHMDEKAAGVPVHLRNFTFHVADPGSMGSKFGVKVVSLRTQGKLAKVSVTYEAFTNTCLFKTVNVLGLILSPEYYGECSQLSVDDDLVAPSIQINGSILQRFDDGWRTVESQDRLPRTNDQWGGMDAILRTSGPFSIVKHTPGVEKIALQISRNLCNYYNADTDITGNYTLALSRPGNVISVAVGKDLPKSPNWDAPIRVDEHGLDIIFDRTRYKYSASGADGIAAVFLRPLPDERLELVVWAANASDLSTAARLVPMLTGSGQPNFIVADRTMLWKGIDGVLAMGFFDWLWQVAPQSYLDREGNPVNDAAKLVRKID